MNAILFDTLKYAHRLKQAGFDTQHAEGAAEALGDALTGTVATKADIDTLGAKIDAVKAALEAKIAGVEAKIDSKFSENVRWMFGAIIMNAAVVAGLIKLMK
jgi:hypothetical protein